MFMKNITLIIAAIILIACTTFSFSESSVPATIQDQYTINTTRLQPLAPLISLASQKGEELFAKTPAEYKNDYWDLSQYFVTENGLAYCAPATMVMVLNALKIDPKIAPEHSPYKMFNQENIFFNNAILNQQITPSRTNFKGITLDQATFMLRQYAPKVKRYYGTDFKNSASFKKTLIDALKDRNEFVIANFYRKSIGEVGGGHFSPVAAYNPKTDQFLILDVARYKYPSVWVSSGTLLRAIQGKDSSSHISRGVIIVSRKKGS
jgi:hypothetical protein